MRQQPSAENNYTAIVDVADSEGGADMYQLTAYWTPASSSDRGNRGRGRGYGYGNTRRDSGTSRNDNRTNNQDIPALHWSGDVEYMVELVWRGTSVTQRILHGDALRNVRTTVTSGVTQNGTVTVSKQSGRGTVEVVQQPHAQNRHTTIIRITDTQDGYGRYTIDATWR